MSYPIVTAYPLEMIIDELERAERKFPTWPTDPLHAHGVLAEEVGELVRAIVQHTYAPTYETKAAVELEARQAAAMAIRFYASLDRYDYRPSEQHRTLPGPFD